MNKISSQDRSALIRLASSLPAGNPTRKAILAGLRSIPFEKEAAGDPGLRRALAARKADGRMWEGQARMQGKTAYEEFVSIGDFGSLAEAKQAEKLLLASGERWEGSRIRAMDGKWEIRIGEYRNSYQEVDLQNYALGILMKGGFKWNKDMLELS